jgi:hypothetical protein
MKPGALPMRLTVWVLAGCGPVTASIVTSDSEDATASTPSVSVSSTTTSLPTGITWDPSPPDTELGAVLTLRAECSLLDGPATTLYRRASDTRWEQLPNLDNRMYPEVLACTDPQAEDYLLWMPDGEMEIAAGGVWHGLSPTVSDNRWVGTAELLNGSTPECDEALAQLGLAWPIGLSITVEDLVDAPVDTGA